MLAGHPNETKGDLRLLRASAILEGDAKFNARFAVQGGMAGSTWWAQRSPSAAGCGALGCDLNWTPQFTEWSGSCSAAARRSARLGWIGIAGVSETPVGGRTVFPKKRSMSAHKALEFLDTTGRKHFLEKVAGVQEPRPISTPREGRGDVRSTPRRWEAHLVCILGPQRFNLHFRDPWDVGARRGVSMPPLPGQ